MQRNVKVILTKLRIMLADFTRGHWSFLGPGSEKEWYGTYSDKPDGDWDKNGWGNDDWILRSRPSDIPCFQRPWKRWITKQRRGKKTILFNGSEQNVELILRTVTSVNQLSIYGAVADMCREASNDTMASRRNLKHMIFWKRWKFLLNPLLLSLITMNSDGETCCKNTSNNSDNYLTTRSYPNCALTVVWKLSKEENISSHLMQEYQAEWYIYAENIRCHVTIRELEREAGFAGIRKLGQSWTFMFVIMKIGTVLEFRSDLCFKTLPLLGIELWMELKNT